MSTKESIIELLKDKRQEALQEVDNIIDQLESTIRYIKQDKTAIEAVPLEGERKIDETELISSILRHVTGLGQNMRTDKLGNRMINIALARHRLDQKQ